MLIQRYQCADTGPREGAVRNDSLLLKPTIASYIANELIRGE
jgi:hypothetical protein